MTDSNRMTNADFDELLAQIVNEDNAQASQLFSVPGVYGLVAEHYNNAVLERWEQQQQDAASRAPWHVFRGGTTTQHTEAGEAPLSHLWYVEPQGYRGTALYSPGFWTAAEAYDWAQALHVERLLAQVVENVIEQAGTYQFVTRPGVYEALMAALAADVEALRQEYLTSAQEAQDEADDEDDDETDDC